MEKRLYRSRSDRMIWGVCGGLAKYFDIDPTIVRVLAVLSIFISGFGILAYIILAIVVPLEPLPDSKETQPRDTIRENIEEMKDTARELGRDLRSTSGGAESESEEVARTRHRRRNVLGIILIAVGIFSLVGSLNLFSWFRWGNLWPLVLVAIGALIIVSSRRRRK